MAELEETEMGESTERRDYAGLAPKKGWPARNYRFWRHRLIPQVFKRLLGESLSPVTVPPADGAMRVTWVGHASFLVQFEDHSMVFDPNWARWHGPVKRQREPGLKLEEVPELDLVLVSHAHFDHLHKKSLKVLRARQGVVVPTGSGKLVRRLGFERVTEMKVWEEMELGGVKVMHTPSHHWGARYGHDTHRDYGGFVVGSGRRKVFHCGDSAYFEGFKEIGKRVDICVALLPIGAYEAPSGRDVHMNPEEAVQAFIDLGAELMVPMHYGTFPLGNEHPEEPVERLRREAERRGLSERIFIPEPGEGIEL
ncbi:MAG: MBL fold metallo-hydrolase [Verrucomicrobiales bacterium]